MDKRFSHQDFQDMTEARFSGLSSSMRQKFVVDLIRFLEDNWDEQAIQLNALNLFYQCLNSLNGNDFPEETLKRVRQKLTRENQSLRKFLIQVLPLERSGSWSVREESYLITQKDRDCATSDSGQSGFFLIAENIRSAANTGSLFRSAECFGTEHIYLCGYTATPEKSRVSRSAMGTHEMVPWSWHSRTDTIIECLQKKGITVLALETCPESRDIFTFEPSGPCALLVGNERHGLSPETLSLCDGVLQIPLSGRKNSLNVAVAYGIAAATLHRHLEKFQSQGAHG